MTLYRAVWNFGPGFLSKEDIRGGEGSLGTDYTENVDTRFTDTVLGPLVTSIDCSGADAAGGGSVGTPATARSMCTSGAINSPEKLLVARGTKLAAIQLTDFTQLLNGSMEGAGAPYAEAVLEVLYTKAADADEQVSILFDNTIYRVLEDIPETGGFTAGANNESHKYRYIFEGQSDSAATSYLGLGRADGTPANQVQLNVLSGATDMDASAWQDIGTISDEGDFTGGAMLGRFPLIARSNGAYLMDQDAQRFRNVTPGVALDSDGNQGYGTAMVSLFGGSVFVPLERSLRIFPIGEQAHSIGPETFPYNTSPVRGRWGRPCETDRWVYWPVYNVENDDSWIVAVRRRLPGDGHMNEFSFFPIAFFDGKESKVMHHTGKKGSQARNVIFAGYDSDVAYFMEGKQDQFPQDTGYPYAAAGTLYGTELQRQPDRFKTITRVIFETAGCSSTETLSVDIIAPNMAATATEETIRFGGTVTQNRHVELVPPQGGFQAYRFYPKLSFARGGTTTNSPKLKFGRLIVEYEA